MAGVLLLTTETPFARPLVNALRAAHPDTTVVLEKKTPRIEGLRRRIRRKGLVTAVGQVGFRAVQVRLARRDAARAAAIWAEAGLRTEVPAGEPAAVLADLDGEVARETFAALAPEVTAVFGTGRLAPGTLAALAPGPVLNLHPGITPRYRGLHSGYWALRAGDRQGYGTTVHLVDEGLDTGPVVEQVRCTPQPGDTVGTHYVRQVAAGVPALLRAVEAARAGRLAARPAGPPSPLLGEPTLWSYLAGGLRTGVW